MTAPITAIGTRKLGTRATPRSLPAAAKTMPTIIEVEFLAGVLMLDSPMRASEQTMLGAARRITFDRRCS
jgi:hypothetical protein